MSHFGHRDDEITGSFGVVGIGQSNGTLSYSTPNSFSSPPSYDSWESGEPGYWRARVDELQQQLNESCRREDALLDRLNWMRDIGVSMSSRKNPSDALGLLLDRTVRMVGAQRGVVYMMEPDGEHLAARTILGGRLREIRLQIGEGLAGHCAAIRKLVNVKNASVDSRWSYAFDQMTGAPTEAVLCVPMLDTKGELMGVIQVINRMGGGHFSVADELVLVSVAGSVSLLMENFRYYLDQMNQNIELNEIRHSLEKRVHELDLLFSLQRAMNDARSEEEEVQSITKAIFATIRCDLAVISFGEDRELHHVLVDSQNREPETLPEPTPWYTALVSGRRPMLLDDVLARFRTSTPRKDSVAHYLGVPLRDNDFVLGTIEVFNTSVSREPFNEDQARLLALIGGQFARAVARNQARRRQEGAERIHALGTMLSGVLHDLKTPIAICRGYVQIMERSNDRALRTEMAESIYRQIDDISTMTREIISYARGEAEVLERVCDITILSDEVERSLATSLAASKVNFNVVCATSGQIRIDEGKLKRVIFNLARNAFEALESSGGHIQVLFARIAENTLEISIEDNGPGIPKAIYERMYDEFFTSGKPSGSGLGLAIVKRLVGQLDGEIDVLTSSAGTTFTVRVPWKIEESGAPLQ